MLRPMTEADLAAAHALTAAVRWPHRVEDWGFVLGLGEGLVAEASGRVVGTALAWRFGPDRGCTGMVIVADAFQGRGLGRRLMDAILPGLGDRAIHLHATEAGAPLYRSLGFVPAGIVRQHQGIPLPVGVMAPGSLRPATGADAPILATLDAEAMGMARGDMIAALLSVSDSVVLEQAGAVQGFALVRDFGRGRVIGPVVAPDRDAAVALIGHCLIRHQGAFLRIDVPESHGLSDWLAGQGLAPVDKALRMIRGPLPAVGRRHGFALVNQALG